MPLSLQLALRELRGGSSGFRVFVAVLARGVGIIAAGGSFAASLSTGIALNARAHFEFDNELALGRYRRCDLAIGQSRQASILRKRHYQQLGKSPAA